MAHAADVAKLKFLRKLGVRHRRVRPDHCGDGRFPCIPFLYER